MKRKALPDIPTAQSSQEGVQIQKEQELANDNAYEMISLLFQCQKVLDKQWSKVHTKDADYNEKLQEYVKKKDEIDTTSENLRELLSTSLHYPNNLEEKVKQTRETNGVMRVRPRLQIKQPTQSQNQKWIWPCHGEIVGEYGEPRATHTHNGIDIKVPIGTPIKAIADGTVVVVGPSEGYGYWVGINHGLVNGIKVSSEYGHLSKWIVTNGQEVRQGQVIGYSGNTGYSFGPHLHLTIRHGNPGKGGGKAVNPWNYIDRTKY